MSGIYGIREVKPVVSRLVSTSSELSSEKDKLNKLPPVDAEKIPYSRAGVVVERLRNRSADVSCASSECSFEERKPDEKEKIENNLNHCLHQMDLYDDINQNNDALAQNYRDLMRQLATVLVEKETLLYQIGLLGQAYMELKAQFSAVVDGAERDPSRLSCLQDERQRLADCIVGNFGLICSDQQSYLNKCSPKLVAIQRDLWRNKFSASSLIVDQLVNQRLFLLQNLEEAQGAIGGLFHDRQEFRKKLHNALSLLRDTNETLNPEVHVTFRNLDSAHSIDDLINACENLSEALHKRLLNTRPMPRPFTDEKVPTVILSETERRANKVLAIDVKALAASNPCDDFQRLVNQKAVSSGCPPPDNLHNIFVNCCKRCEGQTKIV